jgi:[acyl-carrier-protein] S-malonyltransferase
MAAAAAAGRPHGMLSVVGLSDDALEGLCAAARSRCPGSVCQLANYLFPTGRVVSGHLDALGAVEEAAKAAGAMRSARLAVSGAFHTPLMEPARLALAAALEAVAIHAPRVPVWSNVTGAPFPSDPDAIRALLCRQLVEPVRWEAALEAAVAAAGGGAPHFFELGPGSQIKAMVRRVSGAAFKGMRCVSA